MVIVLVLLADNHGGSPVLRLVQICSYGSRRYLVSGGSPLVGYGRQHRLGLLSGARPHFSVLVDADVVAPRVPHV